MMIEVTTRIEHGEIIPFFDIDAAAALASTCNAVLLLTPCTRLALAYLRVSFIMAMAWEQLP